MTLDPEAIHEKAKNYAAAWSSHDPVAVAAHYEADGHITINDGAPTVGTEAIVATVQGFYDGFPDLIVRLDELRSAGNRALFCWTLTGTNLKTGNSIRIKGWEDWRLSDSNKVTESLGRFDAAEFERQVAEGI